MSSNDGDSNNRRSVLKAIGGGLGAIGIASQSARARENVLNISEVSTVLEAAGEPAVESVDVDTFSIQGHTYDKTEIRTNIGTLVYAEPPSDLSLRSSYDEPASMFLFDRLTGRTRQHMPDRFRSLPADVQLGLFLEDGDLVARRSATTRERRALATRTNTALDDTESTPIYGEQAGVYVFPSGNDGLAVVKLDSNPDAEAVNEAYQSLMSGSYTVEIREDAAGDREQSASSPSILSYHEWQGGSCFGGWSTPCVQCVFGGGVCGVCAGACTITGGWWCIACIAGCAGTGGSCGCCLSCWDDLHNPICY